jgi:group II intron reverse transcriptase/maturase
MSLKYSALNAEKELGMQIAKVQESLARKALYQPNTRFDDLFNLVAHPYWLWIATESILANSGANTPGVDGVTVDDIRDATREYAQGLAAELKAGEYQPQPVKRVYIPKANGECRPLGIPTIRDRIVQEAVKMVLEPIMESHFLDCSTGFRPARRTMDAIHLITRFTNNNVKMWWIVEGDIKGCFDNIPHRKLKGVLRQYIKDKRFLALIAGFLSAGIVERGKKATPNRGAPQGGVISPLLANIYLHEMDKVWWERYGSLTEGQKTYRRQKGLGNVRLVRYADDFVVLTNGDKAFAHELRDDFREILTNLGLGLSKDKTRVTHLNDGIEFLGFHLQRVYSAMSNKNIVLVKPTQRNLSRFKEAVRAITARATIGDDPVNKIRALNALVQGWANYYRHANVRDEFAELGGFVHMRMYYWLKAKHSNISARASVKKYVTKTYLTRYRRTKTWGVYGAKLVPMTTIKRKRYYINWSKEGNPYLEYGTTQLRVTDPVPIPDPEYIWRGHSEQSAYAVARLERLEQVGHRCEECGSMDGYLHAHHVIPRRQDGKHHASNLRILCERCHVKTYSQK